MLESCDCTIIEDFLGNAKTHSASSTAQVDAHSKGDVQAESSGNPCNTTKEPPSMSIPFARFAIRSVAPLNVVNNVLQQPQQVDDYGRTDDKLQSVQGLRRREQRKLEDHSQRQLPVPPTDTDTSSSSNSDED